MKSDSHELVEIRLLGRFRVRRSDGSWVEPGEWRTRKSVALLQMLAFQLGQRISSDELMEALWPGSDLEHGRTSLRTAASQIRKVLGQDCIVRSHGGLVLTDAWVDTRRFKALAEQCHQANLDGRHVEAMAAAYQAAALYVHDPELSSEAEDRLVLERDALRRDRAGLFVDAAASALALRWSGNAARYAQSALAADPHSERACRMAMRAYQSVGEVERALTAYQDCKTRLVEEFGVDPSSPTQEAYLELLRAAPSDQPETEFVGLDRETDRLTARLSNLASSGGGCVVVAGPKGAGASRWLAQVAERIDVPMKPTDREAFTGAEAVKDLAEGVAVIDGIESWPRGAFKATVTALRQSSSGAANVVVGVHRTGVDKAADSALDSMVEEGLVERFDLPSLPAGDLVLLTQAVISCVPTPQLVDELRSITGSKPGLVVDTLRSWLDTGRLTSSRDGLDLETDTASETALVRGRHSLADVHDALTGEDLAVLEILAVSETGIGLPGLVSIIADLAPSTDVDTDVRADVERVVSKLEEVVVVTLDQTGRYALQRRLRDEMLTWTRPSTRRHLHRLAAERLSLSVSDRVGHWIEAGESSLACAAAMVGAVDAMHECDFAAAREWLHQVQQLADADTTSPEDKLDLAHRLKVCCQRLGLTDEAAGHCSEVAVIAEAHGLVAPSCEPAEHDVRAGLPQRIARVPLLTRLGLTAATAPTAEVESLLRDTILRTDPRRDVADAIEARLLLIGLVLVPRRNFGDARHQLSAITELGSDAHSSLVRITQCELGVLLGDSVNLAALSTNTDDLPLALTSGLSSCMLSALAHHDHGDPSADKVCDEAIRDAEERQLKGPWRWVAARMLVQHGELDRARAISHGAPWRVGSPTAQILSLLAKAELAMAEHDRSIALASLLRGAEIAQRTGATLLLPEVASRLTILADDADEDEAMEYLDLAELALGEATFGRERVVLMLARAAVRALVGRTVSAAVVAGGAATLAVSLGLDIAANEASRRRAAYLSVAGTVEAVNGEHNGQAYPVTDLATDLGPVPALGNAAPGL